MSKVVVITGANSGMGKCTADTFRRGGDIAICLSLGIDEEYPKFSYDCDITNEDKVKEVLNEIGEKYGHIDVLVNNAGMGVNGALELLPSNIVKKAMDVNVLGAYLVTKYALPYMGKGGKIINIASISAIAPSPFRSLYHFSKSAIHMMSLCQNMELSPAGIDVVSICPGEVKTPFVKNRVKVVETNEKYGKRIARSYEMMERHDNGKRMEPSKIANIIYKQSYKKKSKPVIVVGAKAKLFNFAARVLPTSWFLKITNKVMGGGKID